MPALLKRLAALQQQGSATLENEVAVLFGDAVTAAAPRAARALAELLPLRSPWANLEGVAATASSTSLTSRLQRTVLDFGVEGLPVVNSARRIGIALRNVVVESEDIYVWRDFLAVLGDARIGCEPAALAMTPLAHVSMAQGRSHAYAEKRDGAKTPLQCLAALCGVPLCTTAGAIPLLLLSAALNESRVLVPAPAWQPVAACDPPLPWERAVARIAAVSGYVLEASGLHPTVFHAICNRINGELDADGPLYLGYRVLATTEARTVADLVALCGADDVDCGGVIVCTSDALSWDVDRPSGTYVAVIVGDDGKVVVYDPRSAYAPAPPCYPRDARKDELLAFPSRVAFRFARKHAVVRARVRDCVSAGMCVALKPLLDLLAPSGPGL